MQYFTIGDKASIHSMMKGNLYYMYVPNWKHTFPGISGSIHVPKKNCIHNSNGLQSFFRFLHFNSFEDITMSVNVCLSLCSSDICYHIGFLLTLLKRSVFICYPCMCMCASVGL